MADLDAELHADLIAYYDQEARAGTRTGHLPFRAALRDRFVALVTAEGARAVLDVGAGPGLDTTALHAAGLGVVGVDLSFENSLRMRGAGVPAIAGSLSSLPFRDAHFDAVWTMSTFVHVPRERVPAALGELMRVVRPGGAVAIGTWGGFDWEGVSDRDEIVPPRFFSLSSHDRWLESLAQAGTVDWFETVHPDRSTDWQYQFAILRA